MEYKLIKSLRFNETTNEVEDMTHYIKPNATYSPDDSDIYYKHNDLYYSLYTTRDWSTLDYITQILIYKKVEE